MLMRQKIELDNLTDEKTEQSQRIPQYSTLLISLFPYHADIQIRKQSLKLAFFLSKHDYETKKKMLISGVSSLVQQYHTSYISN